MNMSQSSTSHVEVSSSQPASEEAYRQLLDDFANQKKTFKVQAIERNKEIQQLQARNNDI